METQLQELNRRIDRLENDRNQEVLTLVEILSNIGFFGGIKKSNCDFAKNGQCTFFILKNDTKNTIPITSNCRVKQCKESPLHSHIELSEITCALCQITQSGQITNPALFISKKQKTSKMLKK